MSQNQEGQEYVCHGAPCRCDKGTVPSPLQVTSQQSVSLQGKLMATALDKTFVPFGTCALQNNNPCVPVLLLWEQTHASVQIGGEGGYPLLDKSTIRCAVGGVVSVLSTLQVAMPSPPPVPEQEDARTTSQDVAPILLQRTPPATDNAE